MTCLDSASHRSNFLGVFASYIAPAANSNYYARAHSLAGQAVCQSAPLFGKSPLYELLIRGSGWKAKEGATPENNKKVEKVEEKE